LNKKKTLKSRNDFCKRKKRSDAERAIKKLTGAVPYTDLSLEELREERLKKYEAKK